MHNKGAAVKTAPYFNPYPMKTGIPKTNADVQCMHFPRRTRRFLLVIPFRRIKNDYTCIKYSAMCIT